MKYRLMTLVLTTTLLGACAEDKSAPPTVEKRPVKLEIHGDVRIDDYFWLNQRENPAVIEYLEAENAYTESVLTGTSGLQERLVEEMKSRIRQDDVSAPYKHGEYYYYYRLEEGQEYPVYCRRKGSMDAAEEILLDVNKEAEGEAYFSVRGFKVSPDHKRAGYAVDTTGRRFYDLRFIDLETGQRLPDRIDDVTGNYEWAADGNTLFYVRQDAETLRWDRIYRHEFGSDDDELVFEERDETFSTYVYKSVSGKFIYIASESTLSSEVRYIQAMAPMDEPQVFLPREPEHEYSVTDGGDRFFVISNDNAQNFHVLETPLDNTAKDAWTVVVPHREDVLIEDVDVFSNHIVITGRTQGLTQMEVIDRDSREVHLIDFGETVFEASSGDNYEFETGVFRYNYESLTTPESVYDYDLDGKRRRLIKQDEVLGGFDRNNYESERLFVTARDGAKVPVSLVYRKGLELDGRNPLLQYGYGSYGYSIDPTFSSNRLSLLDRGFVYAIAHVRGGSETGRHWYFDGRQLNKKNTFTDFIDVSRFLIDQGYTSPEHLYARGGSAGGLLMGAVANMAPDLYNGISTRVPFVDIVTTMLDDSIPLTTGEWDEWGDPNEKEFYDYMLSYSPYDQIERQAYPNILVTTSLHDSQVQYWEPAKWVAKLRDYKTDDRLLLLKTDMHAGHGGKTGRFRSLEDTAIYYAFFLSLEGIAE